MNIAYPVTFKTYPSGRIGAFLENVVEAITAGASEAEALDHAQEALVVAMSAYLDGGCALPVPSKAKRTQPMVTVPPRVAIKLAIHEAMREQAMTQAQFGERLGIDGRQVRRILDLDHESKLSQLESAAGCAWAAGRSARVKARCNCLSRRCASANFQVLIRAPCRPGTGRRLMRSPCGFPCIEAPAGRSLNSR